VGAHQVDPPGRSTRPLALVAFGVLALLAIGLAFRLLLLTRSSWLLEGDDALSTLMALAIQHGDRPIMLKNQTYASAYEPYAMALTYTLFGISRVSAKLPELLNSLAVIGTTWLLARVTVGRTAAWFAAALAAVPPVYDLVLWLKPWAPYTEVVVLGSLSLTCAVALSRRTPLNRARSDALLAFGCGVTGGLALWMHPLAIWYLAAAAIALLVTVRGKRWLSIAASGVIGFVVGALPIWLFNLQTGGSTLRFVLSGSQGQTADRWAVFQAWWNNDLPRGAGVWHPWGPSSAWLGALMAIVLVGALAWSLIGSARPAWQLMGRGRDLPAWQPLNAVLVFLVLIPTILVFSGFGGPALNPYDFDATGRYAPPLWSGLAVVIGAFCAFLWRWRHPVAVLAAAIPLAVNGVGILSIDPLTAFQSPYWDKLPADSAPLLAVLRDENVEYVWANHWAGQPLMFDAAAAHQTLYAYDWYDVQAGGIDRFPEYRPLVESATRPAFVLVTDEADPQLERDLRTLGVSFVERRTAPYVVVIPTSRRVHPSEVTGALDYRY
jgi:hypothetical protein